MKVVKKQSFDFLKKFQTDVVGLFYFCNMARTKLSDELKEAITLLSNKEKDKLLFRLIRKDAALVERLTFELLENKESKDDRREAIYQAVDKGFERYRFYSPGYLLLTLRSISGDINRHVKTTKDKYGEIQLNLLMLNKSLGLFGEKIRKFPHHKQRTFNTYVVKRAVKLVGLLRKLHEDYLLDFQEDISKLGHYIDEQPHMKPFAETLGLDIEMLKRGTIY